MFILALHIVANIEKKPRDHQQIHGYTEHGVHMQPKKMSGILPITWMIFMSNMLVKCIIQKGDSHYMIELIPGS